MCWSSPLWYSLAMFRFCLLPTHGDSCPMAIRLSLVALQQWHVMPAAASPCLSCRSLPTSAVWWASWWQRWHMITSTSVLKCLANLHMASTVEYNENNSPRWWMMIELYWVGFHGTSRNRAWLKKQSYFVQIPLSNTTSIPRQQNLWIFLDWFWGSDAEFDPLGFSDTFDIKWLREILGAESSIGQRDSENSERHFWASQSAREKVQKNISNVGFHLESEAWFELKILKNNGPIYDMKL